MTEIKTQYTTGTIPVAIIGIGCMFAESSNLKNFWRLISHGIDGLRTVPDTHWSPEDFFDKDPKRPDYVYCTRGGFIPPVNFDPSEFGIPPANLEATDTSQLLGLVTAKMALKDAGYLAGKDFDRDRASVILGATGTQELAIPLGARLGHPHWRKAMADAEIPPDTIEKISQQISESFVPWQENSFPGLLGNVIAGRISNRLDLGGTNCVVDAACASSLSAMHLGLMELTGGRSDMVVTGGVDMLNDIFMHMCFSSTYILSPTEDLRPFSKHADGTVLGEGLGMLVLKRLADAERDGDKIYAVIKALGASSDGRSQSIYAPRTEGQEKALRAAYNQANVSPDTVELIEAHGTGTRVGDQVEFRTMQQVFGGAKANGRRCALGSVKSQIGHAKAAAGSAGIIKAAMALYHKVLPPTLKAEEPDPNLGIAESPFYLNRQSRPWVAHPDHPRRAGVSSFGFGGSNFHVVLEEYQPRKQAVSWDGAVEILALSAPSPEALATRLANLKTAVERGMTSAEFAVEADQTRQSFSPEAACRLLMAVETHTRDTDGISALLATAISGLEKNPADVSWHLPNIAYGAGKPAGKLALLFPGQGSQYLGMGKDLFCMFPETLAVLENADRRFNEIYPDNPRLSDIVFPHETANDDEKARQDQALRSTDHAQPALGTVSLAMWRVLQRFQVRPTAVCGHSFGELTALCAAGWIDETDLHTLSIHRGRCMAAAGDGNDREPGTMLAVMGPLDELAHQLESSDVDVVLANRNSPTQGVLSGSSAAIAQAETQCQAWGYKTKHLPVAAAFHSPLMAVACKPFESTLSRITFSPTDIAVYANVDGAPYPANNAGASDRLRDQLVRPVEFVKNIENMYAAGIRTFVEVGPKSVLTGLCNGILRDHGATAIALDSAAGKRSGSLALANTLCRLAALGHPVALDEWEETPEPLQKPKMSIPLSGANYRAPRPQRPVRPKKNKSTAHTRIPAPTRAPQPVEKTAAAPAPRETLAPSAPRNQPIHQPPGKQNTMVNHRNLPSSHIDQALRVAEQGLKSMQSLQMKTTEAHQKFLDTQAEATRALQQMLANAQQMTGAVIGTYRPTQASEPVMTAPASALPVDGSGAIPAASPPTVSPVPPPPDPPSGETNIAIAAMTSGSSMETRTANADITAKLLSVVSTLTGYPEDMLDMDMDIESDLGIDSIKRVEILSTVEETIPGLPQVQPEIMGRLKTLGQIVSYLADSTAADTAAFSGGAPPQPPEQTPVQPASSAVNPDEVRATLLSIVATLTGYPEDMLDMDMDIESDLGIDSIKRVEILSTLEETIPGLPQFQPELMGRLRTLGQIADHLSETIGTITTAADDPAPTTPIESMATTDTGLKSDNLQATLLSVVSRLTGYPEDMLDLDMDIESDLGIDSIKRVEILSTLEETIPGLPQIEPEAMGRIRTLGQIVTYLCSPRNDAEPASEPPLSRPATTGHTSQQNKSPAGVARSRVNCVDTPAQMHARRPLSTTKILYVTDDETGLSEALVAAFAAVEQPAEILTRAAVEQMIETSHFPENACGLVLVPGKEAVSIDGHDRHDITFLTESFSLVRQAAPILLAAAENENALLASITRLDGAFGFRNQGLENPVLGGLAGLVKTAAIEWDQVRCRAVDVSPEWQDTAHVARQLAAELLDTSPTPVEVGLSPNVRTTLTVCAAPYQTEDIPANTIQAAEVWVVTGGARGVTAASALALAQQAPVTLALLGRSDEPFPEPSWLAPLGTMTDIKKAIITHDLSGQKPSPRDVETRYRRYMANREMTGNLENIRATGARATYHSVDVRDPKAVAAVLEKIRTEDGPIRGIVHGAGVLEDRLIVDKTPEQVARVLDTKVCGLQNLLAATQNDPLQYLVCFSSVAARFGNQGQADYAMANEVLNKIARLESAARPDCRTIAINWGPWDGGMVTDALKREFERRRIDLIPLDAGARCLVKEITRRNADATEILLGAGLQETSVSENPVISDAPTRPVLLPPKKDLSLLFKREIDVQRLPVLESHQIDGKPVVPFALLTEWIGHSAMHGNPGLYLQGLYDMRLLKGIRLDNETKVIRMMAGKARKKDGVFEVDVEIRNGVKNGKDVIHSRAKAVLSAQIPQAPAWDPALTTRFSPYTKSVRDVYDQILFHGNDLQGIQRIIGLSEQGMAAEIAPAPAPEKWMSAPMRSRWISDPLALDCAFQMACVWCYEQMGAVSLPSYSAAYRQFCRQFPTEGVTAILEIMERSSHKIIGNFTFVDATHTVIATLTGYEAVMDASLYKAFKPQLAAANA